jgi:hypothetical protein
MVRIWCPPNQRPLIESGQFRCRKGYHALNVQTTVDSDGKFTSFNANWPGGTHDSFVLQMSNLWDNFENQRFLRNCFVLGDSGYQCRKWLLPPYRYVRTQAQRRFNNSHRKTRVLVEQVYSRGKKRFSILADKCRVRPEKAAKIVAVCCVLQNIAVSRN